MLATSEISTTTAGQGIDRRADLSTAEFIREYRDPLRPVILTDATRDWPARHKFTFEFFRTHCGDRELVIQGKQYRLGEFIDLLLASTRERPAPYPCKLNVRKEFADLASDIEPRFDLSLPNRVGSPLILSRYLSGLNDLEVFLGGPGGEFPYLHYDYLGLFAFINQIVGEKEFTIYPPEQEPLLYPDPKLGWVSTIENHHQPDLQKYPLFARATPTRVTLRPGETLFIPCGWWHTARSLTPSISVAFDQLCSSNWSFFTREVCRSRAGSRLKALVARALLGGAGTLLGLQERLSGRR